jgi:hypothetical protein
MLSSQPKLRETKRLASAWAAAILAVALAGCGGGGSDGSGTAPPGSAPVPAPGPAPVPAPAPEPPPPPAAAQLQGRLWHDDYALDYRHGTQIASLEGNLPTLATTSDGASPWPDGTQFVITDSSKLDYTDLKVIDLASSQTLYSLRAPGYLRGVRPSPTSKTMVMAEIGDDSISPADTIVIDLTTGAVLRRFSDEEPMNWLPDGRYMRVLGDGSLRIGSVDGGEVDAGRVQPPPDHTAVAFHVSPKGDKMTWTIVHHISPTPETDIWVSDLDGSHLERVTQTKMSNYGIWSPDGSKIAFDVDTGSFCTGFGCMGGCNLWWVPITSRNVIAVPASGDALRFTVKNSYGLDRTLGCDLMGWTK